MSGEGKVLTKPGGHQLDHIGLAVNDLDKGVARVAELTGVQPIVHPPEPNAPYQSASLKIGEKSFLEILGPNLAHGGLHPLKSLLRSMPPDELTLWFWYVGTDDFDKFESKVVAGGRCIENKVVQDEPGINDEHSTYVRGQIGPGFDPVFPNAIQWKTPPRTELDTGMQICPLKDFHVTASAHDVVGTFFNATGIDASILKQSGDGKSYLSLTISTPKGDVQFKSEAKQVTMLGVLYTCLMDVFRGAACCTA